MLFAPWTCVGKEGDTGALRSHRRVRLGGNGRACRRRPREHHAHAFIRRPCNDRGGFCAGPHRPHLPHPATSLRAPTRTYAHSRVLSVLIFSITVALCQLLALGALDGLRAFGTEAIERASAWFVIVGTVFFCKRLRRGRCAARRDARRAAASRFCSGGRPAPSVRRCRAPDAGVAHRALDRRHCQLCDLSGTRYAVPRFSWTVASTHARPGCPAWSWA